MTNWSGARMAEFFLSRARRPRPVNLSIDVPEDSRPSCHSTDAGLESFLRRLVRRRKKKGYKVTRKGRLL